MPYRTTFCKTFGKLCFHGKYAVKAVLHGFDLVGCQNGAPLKGRHAGVTRKG